MFWSQGVLLIHECLDSVDHVLDEFFFGLAKSSLIGNVKYSVVGLSVLSVNASDLDFVLVSNRVEGSLVGHQFGQLYVNGTSHGRSKVRWARGNVTEVIVVCEFYNRFDVFRCSAKSLEYSPDVSAWLHGNNSKLILFVDPHEECLGIIMEDASARWPVSIKATRFEESITLPV